MASLVRVFLFSQREQETDERRRTRSKSGVPVDPYADGDSPRARLRQSDEDGLRADRSGRQLDLFRRRARGHSNWTQVH